MGTGDELIECPDLSNKLTTLFPNLKIWKDGRVYQTKELVGQEYNLKFYIYPNDHNLPHFHVRSTNGEINASFKIENGECIEGRIKNPNDLKKIRHFYEHYRVDILKKWGEIHK